MTVLRVFQTLPHLTIRSNHATKTMRRQLMKHGTGHGAQEISLTQDQRRPFRRTVRLFPHIARSCRIPRIERKTAAILPDFKINTDP